MGSGDWRPTACVLCHINCGLEVQTEGRRITRVRGDRANPGSHGYLCQKAQRLTYYGDHADRLTAPLKRQPGGAFAPISWDLAVAEISERLAAIRDRHGPRALALYGGGGQGNHMGGAYAVSFLRALGSSTVYNSLGQERTGDYWVNGRLFGAQTCNVTFQIEDADLVLFVGANPWMSHGVPAARTLLNAIAKDPARHMIVVDPVRTHTARKADLHLQLRPGTDAFLLGALLAMLDERGALDGAFLAERTTGAEAVLASLRRIPVDAWLARSGIARADAERAAELIAGAKAMSIRADLGILQSPNSTLNSYLEKLLAVMTGHFNRPGANTLHGWLQPLWGNSKGARTAVTGMPEIGGIYPPNRLPAEILTDHPGRLRALLVDSANPANSAADTARIEKALAALELLVAVDVAMTETAQLAHYVLPAAAQFEKWEFTLFTFEFPTNVIHLRAPLFEPPGEALPEPEIYARLARRSGLLPGDAVLGELRDLASRDRAAFAARFGALVKDDPTCAAGTPIILSLTLGRTIAGGAASAAALWPACQRAAVTEAEAVRRAIGGEATGPALGEALFARILDARSATPFMTHGHDDAWRFLRNKDGRIRLAIPEMLEWLGRLEEEPRDADPAYPFTLMAGQRRSYNVNQIMRHPAWRKTEREGTLRIRAADLAAVDGVDGGWITAESRAGRLTMRAEVDETLPPGVAAAPHGYGMSYPDGRGGRVTVGPRVNLLSPIDDCDPIAATPHHKTVPVALRRASNREADAAENDIKRMRAVIAAEGSS